jgi:hypothetical protein
MKHFKAVIYIGGMLLVSGCSSASIPRVAPIASPSLQSRLLSMIKYDAHGWYHPLPIAGEPGQYMLRDGTVITGPANDPAVLRSAALRRELSLDDDTCTNPAWSSNVTGMAPPACDSTGAFRRAYSTNRALGEGDATVYVPSQTGMPSPPGYDDDTGYIYIELWPTNNLSDPSEGGLVYDAGYDRLNLYTSDSVDGFLIGKVNFQTNTYVGFDSYVGVEWNAGEDMKWTCTGIETEAGDSTHTLYDSHATTPCPAGFELSLPNSVWVARMTTIGEKHGNHFEDGSDFKGIQWIGAGDEYYDDVLGDLAPWDQFNGFQKWPNDSTKIIVNYVDQQDETVEINFHP